MKKKKDKEYLLNKSKDKRMDKVMVLGQKEYYNNLLLKVNGQFYKQFSECTLTIDSKQIEVQDKGQFINLTFTINIVQNGLKKIVILNPEILNEVQTLYRQMIASLISTKQEQIPSQNITNINDNQGQIIKQDQPLQFREKNNEIQSNIITQVPNNTNNINPYERPNPQNYGTNNLLQNGQQYQQPIQNNIAIPYGIQNLNDNQIKKTSSFTLMNNVQDNPIPYSNIFSFNQPQTQLSIFGAAPTPPQNNRNRNKKDNRNADRIF